MRQFYRWLLYLAGLFILALGLTLNTKTGLGVTPIISVPYSIAQVFGFNFGDATLAAYCLFVAIQFLLKGKPVRWADLLQLPLSLVFTRVLNLLDGAVPAAPQGMPARLCLLAAAILCTGVGAAMSVDMKLVPNPGDGIVAAIAQRTGRELGFTKNWFDTANVGITLVFGLVMGHPLCGIGLGTVLAMLGVGRVMALFNRLCLPAMGRLAFVPAARGEGTAE